jgi:hypothetical protein
MTNHSWAYLNLQKEIIRIIGKRDAMRLTSHHDSLDGSIEIQGGRAQAGWLQTGETPADSEVIRTSIQHVILSRNCDWHVQILK